MFVIIIIYLYLYYGLCKVYNKQIINPLYLIILFGGILKMAFDYRVCTVAYVECKLRAIPRESSIVNNILDPMIDMRYTDHTYPIYIFGFIILYYNIYSIAKYLKNRK